MSENTMPGGDVEPWLRGSRTATPAVQRAVLHALDLAREDVERWALVLDPPGLEAQPFGLPSVAFQVRHMARSLDRLLTYAEGAALTQGQLALLRCEHTQAQQPAELGAEFHAAIASAQERIARFGTGQLAETRTVGRAGLPTTLGGLLVHVADHTQRHVGQAITTAKLVSALRSAALRAEATTSFSSSDTPRSEGLS